MRSASFGEMPGTREPAEPGDVDVVVVVAARRERVVVDFDGRPLVRFFVDVLVAMTAASSVAWGVGGALVAPGVP